MNKVGAADRPSRRSSVNRSRPSTNGSQPAPSEDQPRSGQRQPLPPAPPWWRNVWWLLAIAILIWNLVTIVAQRQRTVTLNLPYSVFYDQLQSGNVAEVSFQGTAITGTLERPITYPPAPSASATPAPAATAGAAGTPIPSQTSANFSSRLPDFGDPALLPELRAQGVEIKVSADTGPPIWATILENVLPWLLLIGVFLFISRRAGQAQQGIFGFGRSRAKLYSNTEDRVTFTDVAGVDEAKADLQDIIDFLRDPSRYQRLGGRIPRGVLLVGPPGTGKTLLARAVAGEANVPFFSISGPEFVEVLVGVGASRVRDLFEQAKKQGPSIIFIDEIDAVGRRRGTGIYAGSNEEREQTLNQILVEMDGFSAEHTAIVLAATNRADVLDPALLRPGRFDRQVVLDRPDRAGREAILKVHAKGVQVARDVDFGVVARATPGMTGADLANLVNEAALLAARRSLKAVDQQCLQDALEKIQLGAERPLVLSEDDRRVVAYHESGHALVALLLPNADPVNRVTIVPRGHALGVTLQLPIDDRYNYSRTYLMTRIAVALGGRVSEELVLHETTTGAENDLELATGIIRQMVTRWGMSERVGLLVQAERQDPYLGGALNERPASEYLSQQIDAAMQKIASEQYEFTRELLTRNRAKLDQLANLLLEHESIDAEQIKKELGLPKGQPEKPQRVPTAVAS